MDTSENLKRAFAGECQAIRKYTVFSAKADIEGYPGIAKLFHALAISEVAHANSQFRLMNELKSTRENLATAIKVEESESKGLYPEFMAQAQKENDQQAVECFKNALAAEQVHFSLLIEALKRIEAGENPTFDNLYVCGNCGNTTMEIPAETCPACGITKDKIGKID